MYPTVSLAFVGAAFFSGIASATVTACPGVIILGGGSNDNACCVGGSNPSISLPSISLPSIALPRITARQVQVQSCAAIVPTTASDYYELLSSITSSLQRFGTHLTITETSGLDSAGIPTGGPGDGGNGGSSGGSGGTTDARSVQINSQITSGIVSQVSTDNAADLIAGVGMVGAAILGAAAVLL